MKKLSDYSDIIGLKIGEYEVIEYSNSEKLNRQRQYFYKCRCGFCGAERLIERQSILRKQITRCNEHRKKTNRLLPIWTAMVRRCSNPHDNRYENYGKRGISVCKEWQGNSGFWCFCKWALENGYNPTAKRGECTLDRINVDKDYEPQNCRWIDNVTQMNNRTDNYYITYKGERKSVTTWAREIGIKPSTLYQRITKLKWDVEKAMTTPLKGKGVVI